MYGRSRLGGAIAGGVFAGLALSVWMLIGEVATGEPSQLIEMERQVAGWFGHVGTQAVQTASMAEEYIGNLGHLLLSAVAGAAYAIGWRRDTRVLLNGFVFGMAFYVVAHAVVGPLIGLTPPMWQVPPRFLLLGVVINAFFGVCTVFFADQFGRKTVQVSGDKS